MKQVFFSFMALFVFSFVSMAQIKVNPVATEKIQPVPTATARPVAFRLSDAVLSALPSSSASVLNTSLKEFDLSNNVAGNQFKAPETGVYHFDVNLTISPAITDYKNYLRFHLALLKGGTVAEQFTLMNPQTAYTTYHSLRISTTLLLNKGDVISTRYSADAEPGTGAVNVVSANFSGFKVASMQQGVAEGTIR